MNITAKWVKIPPDGRGRTIKCSFCHAWAKEPKHCDDNFCYNCGAKMDSDYISGGVVAPAPDIGIVHPYLIDCVPLPMPSSVVKQQESRQDDFMVHMLKCCSNWNEESITENIENLTSALASNKEVDENTKALFENEVKGLERCLKLLRTERSKQKGDTPESLVAALNDFQLGGAINTHCRRGADKLLPSIVNGYMQCSDWHKTEGYKQMMLGARQGVTIRIEKP